MKKIFSFVLALALVVALVPGRASAESYFTDVNDTETERNVEVLRLLGIVGGDGTGLFHPDDSLTRAEFCKMAILLQGRGDEAARYASRTIFPDVPASYWACGYINLASLTAEKQPGLMHGFPDGTFLPKKEITYGEAVTVLMRVLGYSDADTSGIWPQGYLDLGATAGLTKGLSLGGGEAITRAQAAKLFVNALSATKQGGGTLKKLSDELLLMTIDPVKGVMRTTDGKTDVKEVEMASPVMTAVFDGLKGRIIYDENDRAVSFLPSLVQNSSGSYVSVDTGVALIVTGSKSTAGFDVLTGNSKNYSIIRNGVRVSSKELRQFDIATYSPENNAVFVCDTRIKVLYESAMPTPRDPLSIRALDGTVFEIMPSARENVAQYHPGQTMILMLTADGRIGAVASPDDENVNANALGYVNAEGKVTLFCGSCLIPLACKGSDRAGRVVSIMQGESKTIYLNEQVSNVDGALDVAEWTVGSKKLAEDAVIIRDGVLTSISELEESRIERRKLLYMHTNSSNKVDMLVISDVRTEYVGIVKIWEVPDPNGETEQNYISYVSMLYSGGETNERRLTFKARTGDYALFKIDSEGNFYGYDRLNELGGRTETAVWIGTGAVNFGGRTYTIDPDVACYNADQKTWFNSLQEALEYAGTLRLFELDGVIRAIEVRY
ncbi:MAG: S-layer homology domain-containing protein [Oscillospiraceae bacterium]|nr:S-layer homology domain-containing protein [Oscillospiraceae bacterium]